MILIWAAGASELLALLTCLFYLARGDEKSRSLSEKLELAGGVGIINASILLAYYLLEADTEYSYVFRH